MTTTTTEQTTLVELTRELDLGAHILWRCWKNGLITARRHYPEDGPDAEPIIGPGGPPATVDHWEANRIRCMASIHKHTGVSLKAILQLDNAGYIDHVPPW